MPWTNRFRSFERVRPRNQPGRRPHNTWSVLVLLGTVVPFLTGQRVLEPSASTDDPVRVLQRFQAETGGSAWSSVQAVACNGEVTAEGFTGPWKRVDDRRSAAFHESYQLGPTGREVAWDSRHSWRRDVSGGRHRLNSGLATQDAVTESWLGSRRFFSIGNVGARLDKPRHVDKGKAYTVIVATPQGGLPVELRFEGATGLLASFQKDTDLGSKTVQYGDYRRVGQLSLPFAISTVEDGSLTSVVKVNDCQVNAPIPPTEFDQPPIPSDFTLATSESTIPFQLKGYIGVRAMLNGTGPFTFILELEDTTF